MNIQNALELVTKFQHKSSLTVLKGVILTSTQVLKSDLDTTLSVRIDDSHSTGTGFLTAEAVKKALITKKLDVDSAVNYPELPSIGKHIITDMVQYSSLKSIAYAMGKSDVRFFLNGLAVSYNDTGVTNLVASDGHRLARMNLSALNNHVIIPRDAVLLALKVFSKKEPIQLSIHETGVTMSQNDISISAQKTDMVYPPFDRINNQPVINNLVVPNDLRQLLTRMKGVKNQGVAFEFSKQGLVVSTLGEVIYSDRYVDVTNDQKIGFNLGYLQDILKNTDSSVIQFYSRHLAIGAHVVMSMRV